MHELSLAGQVPSPRHPQLLRILAGVAAMPPHAYRERRSIYKPRAKPQQPAAASIGARQDVQTKDAGPATLPKDLFYVQLVRAYGDGGDEREREYVEYYGVPEAGQRAVTARAVTVVEIEEGEGEGEAEAFVAGLGYDKIEEYMVSGEQLYHEDVTISLYRVWLLRPLGEGAEAGRKDVAVPGPDGEKLAAVPLGGSEDWVVTAAVRVEDGRKPGLVQEATEQLVRFRETMRGIVDMRVPNRLALDTRVK